MLALLLITGILGYYNPPMCYGDAPNHCCTSIEMPDCNMDYCFSLDQYRQQVDEMISKRELEEAIHLLYEMVEIDEEYDREWFIEKIVNIDVMIKKAILNEYYENPFMAMSMFEPLF